ncbi:MAG: tyrosine-type recombinase/integrase [Planctomycetes bacterium]|nr:tyrosine-type recombinase/integrase [Planctomycetota bacterium]
MLKEPKKGEIVYCTRQERERIIAMAKATEWPDWMAVPIAFYSGMRKEEIARMEWKDIQFAEGLISVPISKTLEPRLLPMSAQLRELLESVQEADRHGHVVNMPAGADRLFRLENLHRKIRKLNQGIGRWKKDKSKNKTDAEKEQKPIPDERIGWNAWRHTFGSLLSQSGVSLDKISSWMGNTPDVCRRHYAQFVPRDRHDEDIDKL